MIKNLYTKIVKLCLTATCIFISLIAGAQEEKPSVSLAGSIDVYYRGNINAPNSGEDLAAPGTAFANLPGFALGMANLIGSYEGEKVGFVADLVFGPRGTDATFASPMYSMTGNIVNQLYAYWKINDKLKLTLGNFNTYLGYEVISPVDNFNYSTSYLFSYGPFSHTGLKADFSFTQDLSLMLSVMNPTDLTEFDPTGKYSFGAQLGYKSQYLNLLIDSHVFEIDYTGGFAFSDKFYLGINGAYHKNTTASISFGGFALYPEYQFSKQASLGLRAEYFKETGEFGAIGATDENGKANVLAFTLTGNYKIGRLTLKPELRLDNASEDNTFINDAGDPRSNLSSFLFAAVYGF